MATTRTSSASSIAQAAFLDELEKISADLTGGEKMKRWIKGALLTAGGAAVGTGAVMVGDRALHRALGPTWSTLSPGTKKLLAVPAIGLTTIGALIAAQKLLEEQRKGVNS
jgi:hypothetical protein